MYNSRISLLIVFWICYDLMFQQKTFFFLMMMTNQQSLANRANEMRYQRLSYFILSLFIIDIYISRMQRTIRPRSFPLSFFRYFTRQITRENKIEGKEEGTPTAKSWLFAYRYAGQLRQRSKNPYVDCCALSISLSYLYSDAPGLVPNQQKKKKKKNKKQEREKKKLPGQREDIKLVHSSSTARLISHLTNFSFVFADSNREDSPKINVTIQIIL